MDNKNQKILPIQYVFLNYCEEDEIDLRDLLKTILKYKKFIIIFTFFGVFLSIIYLFFAKPIYKITSILQVGYIQDFNKKIYLDNSKELKVYIKNNFDFSYFKKKYPAVDVFLIKNTSSVLKVEIMDFSNESALKYLKKIIFFINKIEDDKINKYINNIKSQLKILKKYLNILEIKEKHLKTQLSNIKDSLTYKILLEEIDKTQQNIVSTKLKINNLNNKISKENFVKAHIIGHIIKYNFPEKSKKQLILIVSFITSFILAIFLVFFIEFIKDLRNENN